jgi:hypothetical protein
MRQVLKPIEMFENTSNLKMPSVRKALEFLGLTRSHRFRRRKLRVAVLVALVVTLSLATIPLKTVKGLVTDTGIPNSGPPISLDGARVAFMSSPSTVTVYDTDSSTVASFAAPAPFASTTPVIYGNKIVIASGSSFTAPMGVYYCVLPVGVPLSPCGPWTLVATILCGAGCTTIAFLARVGYPVFNGNLAAWPTTTGFSYYQFTTGTTTSVALSGGNVSTGKTSWISTNGAIISFAAKPNLTASTTTVMYYDTTSPGLGIVDTGLPGTGPSLSQYVIAFDDNSTLGRGRVRYYDILRGQASPVAGGPVGDVLGSRAIWGDRIVFKRTCGTVSCLGYWNIHIVPGSSVQPFLSADAAPALLAGAAAAQPAIYDKLIAFAGSNGNLQFVRVPMTGDVDLDGKVDIFDVAIAANCFGQFLKNSTFC